MQARICRPDVPAGFAPFNIQNIGGTLYVTYAKQDLRSTMTWPRRWQWVCHVRHNRKHCRCYWHSAGAWRWRRARLGVARSIAGRQFRRRIDSPLQCDQRRCAMGVLDDTKGSRSRSSCGPSTSATAAARRQGCFVFHGGHRQTKWPAARIARPAGQHRAHHLPDQRRYQWSEFPDGRRRRARLVRHREGGGLSATTRS